MPITRAPQVLIFAGCGIGDLILATPLFSSISKALPGSRITVLLRPDLPGEVLTKNPDVEKVFHYPSKSALYLFPRFPNAHKNILRVIRFLMFEIAFLFGIRLRRFDISMHLLPSGIADADALITFLCGAKIRVGPQLTSRSKMSKWCYTHSITWDNYRHVVENNLDNLRALGFNNFDYQLKLFINTDHRKKAEEILAAHKTRLTDGRIIGMHTGGGNSRKPYWPLARFAQVARYLIESQNCRVAVFFGPRENEAIKAFENAPIIPFSNLNIGIVFGVIEKCSLFISSDTGLGHAAAALQVPTLTLFGNGNQRKHEHWGNKHYAINKISQSVITGVETGYYAGETGKQALERIQVGDVIGLLDSIMMENAEKITAGG